MNRILTFLIFLVISGQIKAESRSSLILRAIVPISIVTEIVRTDLSSTKSLWTFSSQINSEYLYEGQKFEVEGLDQKGIESHVKMVTGNDRKIQYEVLITKLKMSMKEDKPIFLKISAN